MSKDDMGLLLPQAVEVKAVKILEDKIDGMQRAMDELYRFKQLYEQSQNQFKEKDREIAELKTRIGSLEITKMEDNNTIRGMKDDLKRMGEIENRDLDLLRTKIINTMQFLVSTEQAKMIGGLAVFSERMIMLKFDGNTGALIKAVTDTDKQFAAGANERSD